MRANTPSPAKGAAAGSTNAPITPGGPAPTSSVPAQWRWHYRVLLNLQDRLLSQQRELTEEITQPLEPHSMSEADTASDEFDHDLALVQLSAEQDALYEVTQALDRIRQGNYGICPETGKMIPSARLKALPWARFTMKVQKRLEKEKLLHSIHLNEATSVREDNNLSFASEASTPLDENEGPVSTDKREEA